MMQQKIAIIGGGASGLMAAITAAEAGAEVTIFEHLKPGKKILSTGNGKCNLTNLDFGIKNYNSSACEKLEGYFKQFSVEDTLSFFKRIGMMLRDKNGYVYPYNEQATMVLQILMNRISQLGIKIIMEHVCHIGNVNNDKPGKRVWLQTEADKQYYFDSIIMTCGSKAAPKTGSDGSGYGMAKELGHKLIPVLPSLVQLRCKDVFCKDLAGIRTQANIHILDEMAELTKEEGELQLTDYGISGIPVFQLSGLVNRYLYENKNASLTAKIDFMPDVKIDELESFMKKRMALCANMSVNELICGTLNQKLCKVILKIVGVREDAKVKNLSTKMVSEILYLFKNFTFHINGSNGFEQAQVCCGGVDLNEVTEQLESIYAPNIYFAGEILDVDGRCGGYNLQWAWTSGYIAGLSAAKNRKM